MLLAVCLFSALTSIAVCNRSDHSRTPPPSLASFSSPLNRLPPLLPVAFSFFSFRSQPLAINNTQSLPYSSRSNIHRRHILLTSSPVIQRRQPSSSSLSPSVSLSLFYIVGRHPLSADLPPPFLTSRCSRLYRSHRRSSPASRSTLPFFLPPSSLNLTLPLSPPINNSNLCLPTLLFSVTSIGRNLAQSPPPSRSCRLLSLDPQPPSLLRNRAKAVQPITKPSPIHHPIWPKIDI